MPYCTEADLEALLPAGFLTEALDDDNDGNADSGLLDAVIDAADTEIDSFLGQRYAVPLSPVPALANHASKVFSLDTLYRRRGFAEEQNPWAKQAEAVRKQLMEIGKGDRPLTPDNSRKRPPVSTVTQDSNLHDPDGRVMS